MFTTSPISKALQEIHFNIPEPVLYSTFMNNRDTSMVGNGSGVDGAILNTVIRPRVMVDCNLLGGREIKIDLSQCARQYVDGYNWVYIIPKELTDGRSIVSVLSLMPSYGGMYSSGCNSNALVGTPEAITDLTSIASEAMNAYGREGVTSNASLELIGENTVLVKWGEGYTDGGVLRVRIENEENMNNLQPTAYRIFAQLCILATKSYIHNAALLSMRKAEIYNGASLDSLRDYISTLDGAEEQYQELLATKWQRVSLVNDDERMNHLLNLTIPNGI